MREYKNYLPDKWWKNLLAEALKGTLKVGTDTEPGVVWYHAGAWAVKVPEKLALLSPEAIQEDKGRMHMEYIYDASAGEHLNDWEIVPTLRYFSNLEEYRQSQSDTLCYLDCKQVARWNLDAFTLVQNPKDPKAPVHIFHPDTGALMGILLPCILKEAGHGR